MIIYKTIHNGYNSYLSIDGNDCATGMDVGLLSLEEGEAYSYKSADREAAFLLFAGEVTFIWNGETRTVSRPDCFNFDPWCLHVCNNVPVLITAKTHAEIYVQATENDMEFPCKLYSPEDTLIQHAGDKGELKGCMKREIKTFFDYENAPYSNMVLGEVLNYPGKWSSYPPHHHPQPEVYFYRFDKPEGFGASFANGEVYVSRHNSLTVINHSFHSQTSAPGYAMCYAWGIRHLPNDPWQKTRIDDPEHAWLWKADANEHIFDPEEA